MGKIKIAVWGITDAIWNDIKRNLDWRRVEIAMFIDNDPYKTDRIFEGKRIWAFGPALLEEIEKVDYILIAAYSGYRQILQLLKDNGIREAKIQLYMSKGLKEYSFGKIERVNSALIREIYHEPGKILDVIENYNYDAAFLDDMPSLEENMNKWYKQNSIIVHACGGYVNNQKVMYSNSKEALETSLDKGVKVIECDVLGIEHDEVICVHDYDRWLDAKEHGCTTQTLEEVLERLVEYPEVYLLIDVKWEKMEEYNYYLSSILESIERIAGEKSEVGRQLKKQIILEVYEEESIKSAQGEGFDVFFTQYRNPDRGDYKKIVRLCLKYNIGIVGYDFRYVQSHNQVLSVFKQKNISVFAYSCDSITEYSKMRRKGLDGIFSNYLL